MDYKDLLVKYGVFLGKRFNRKQKIRFLNTINQEFLDLGYKVQPVANKEGRNQIVNLYAGDILTANTIIQVNYDTPLSKTGFKLPYQPFDLNARSKENLISQLIFVFVVAITGVPFVLYAGKHVFNNGTFDFMKILFIGVFIVYGYISYRVSKGIGNVHNMNRYSASIVGAIDLASKLSVKQKKNIAFAFTDLGSINLEGSFLLRTHLDDKMDNKLVIHLDCLAAGDTIKIQGHNVSNNFLNKIKETYEGKYQVVLEHVLVDSKQLATIYPKSIALAVGEESNGKFIVPNVGTRHDIDVDVEELELIINAINKAYL